MLAALLATACKDSEPASPTPAPLATEGQPEPLAPVPEGVLLVQESDPIGYPRTFAIRGSEVREITKGPLLSVSPDGRHLAAIEQDGGDFRAVVRIFAANGEETFAAEAAPGTRSANAGNSALLWSPDASRLAYALPSAGGSDAVDVFTVSADGSGNRKVAAGGGYTLIGWTPDGRLLVYDGGGLALLGEKEEKLPLADAIRAAGGFQVSPDGRYLAFRAGDDLEAQELWVMDMDSGKSRVVAHPGSRAPSAEERYVSAVPPAAPPPEAPAAMLKGPPPLAWSPDGRRIAYYRYWADEGDVFHSELRVVNAGTLEDMSVMQDGGWSVAWSPDGRYLAGDESDGVGVVLLGPGDVIQTLDVEAYRVLWSPAGKLIAVSSGDVRLVDPETGTATAVRTANGNPVIGAWGWEPARSPDGRYLALVTSEDAGLNDGSMYAVDTQTGEATQILGKGSFHPAGWLGG